MTTAETGRYDYAVRRQSLRKGREKGCSIYIPQAELEKAGYSPDEPAPLYRAWGSPGGGVFVRLYRKAS